MTTGPTTRRLDLAGVLVMIVCCAFWGGNAVAVKFATPDLPPFGVAGFRFILSLPILAAVCWMVKQPLWTRPENRWLLLGHGLITAAQIGTFNWGTSHSTAGPSSIYINVHPLLVAPLAWWVLDEQLGWRCVAGLSAAAVGVGLVLASSFKNGAGDFVGALVVLASGGIFAVQTIFQKLSFSRIPPATLLFNQSIVAIPMFFLYSGLFEGFASYHFTTNAILALIYQGVAVSGFCFSIWMLLLKRYPAAQLATVAFVTPMFGVGFGRWFKAEALSWQLLLGGVLVGIGIFLTSSDRAGHARPDSIELPGEDAV